MLNILIIEDEQEIADTLEYAISTEGMTSTWASNGEQARTQLESNTVDFCILDVGLPDCSGFELLKEIRQATNYDSELPVLMLTARNEEIDRVLGLEIGADDYVAKPFSPREVVARIKTINKRAAGRSIKTPNESNTTSQNSQGDFHHNPQSHRISYQGELLELTKAEYSLLHTMINQPGRVFSRRQLIEQVWSSHHPSDDRAIDTHIKTLRSKLRSHNAHKDFIVTHRGFGYSFEL